MKGWRWWFQTGLRWTIVGATGFFLLQTFRDHWREVVAIQLDGGSLAYLALALGVTLLAHIWSGWVWGWILQGLQIPVSLTWAVQVYLQTNLAKYLPGNVWHFYGRVRAIANLSSSPSLAILSVILDPLLMAAGALILALGTGVSPWQWLGLGGVLVIVHPVILNPVLQKLGQRKAQAAGLESTTATQLRTYPWQPLLGETLFVVLRGTGFVLVLAALQPLTLGQVPRLLSAFSWAWLLGLVVPGAPGGMGVFEATAIALMGSLGSPGVIFSAVALYRLLSILAEVLGAGLVWLEARSS